MNASDSRDALVESTRHFLRQAGHAEADIHTLHVPGRIEVFGKHTDYCGGRSLLVATEQGIVFSVAPRGDRRIRFSSLDYNVAAEFDFSTELQPRIGDWSNYPMTVARRVARNFPLARTGCDIAVAGDLPAAAGMSSSSAIIVGTFFAIDRINQISQSEPFVSCIESQESLSAYLGSIENGSSYLALTGDRGVGTAGGSQDHTAIVCSRAEMLGQFSFCPVRHEQSIPMPPELCFAIGVSGVVAEKTGDALHRYNNVAGSVREIVRMFNLHTGGHASSLAEVLGSSPGAAGKLRGMLAGAAELIKRFEQFIEESDVLIPRAACAFAAGDWKAVGMCADRSQILAEQSLGNQIAETIQLQRSARACGALASSAFGAGFGGSVWALIEASDAEPFIRRWSRAAPGRFVTTRPGPGARWIL